jgi:hypothetical protein
MDGWIDHGRRVMHVSCQAGMSLASLAFDDDDD